MGNYEYDFGRESVLEMLATIFSSFPSKLLESNSSLFFIPLSSCLVNDDSAKCRKLAALALKSFLTKLSNVERDKLFTMCLKWFQNEKVNFQRLASIVMTRFVEIEESKFERHINDLLPLIKSY